MKHFIKPTIVCMLLSVVSGCITSFVPEVATDVLSVNSNPSGAHVALSTGAEGSTPCQFVLPRSGKLMVVISKEGFEQVEVMVQGKPSLKRVMSNLTFGSPNVSFIGGVEASQLGADFELKPNPIEVKLKPKKEQAQ
tara:strand:- start:311 stop:721 length:411 start_codon:yes stop_codon:yes gene_type:complete